MIIILLANYVKIDSIDFKESMIPAIAVYQHSKDYISITARNSRFLSASGRFVFKRRDLPLVIDKSKFDGDGGRALQGIAIKEEHPFVIKSETANALGRSIGSTCFRYLTEAVIITSAF